jgi:hypothetical protein
MILKLLGLAKRSEVTEAWHKIWPLRIELAMTKIMLEESNERENALFEQNVLLGAAYEDLKRDRDRLQRRIKVLGK